MLKGSLKQRVELDDVDRKSRASGKIAVLVVGRLDLDRIERDEHGLAKSLGAEILQSNRRRTESQTLLREGQTSGDYVR